jgi:hypothetical protein
VTALSERAAGARTIIVSAALCIASPASAGDEVVQTKAKAPIMQSFSTLKWTGLPERPGMEIAVLSGDPKRRVRAPADRGR